METFISLSLKLKISSIVVFEQVLKKHLSESVIALSM